MHRNVFFISDGTGITAESFGQSLLAQFTGPEFRHVTLPYVDSVKKAAQALETINRSQSIDGTQPVLFMTVLNEEVSRMMHASGAYVIDLFQAFLPGLEQEFGQHPLYRAGQKRSTHSNSSYHRRIEAVQFALDNDDGCRIRHYDKADIILLGVSRSGKTPTCIYLGLQFGIFAANYPITEEDLEITTRLPGPLEPYHNKLFGLTIHPGRLAGIRHERKPNSRYASRQQCQHEVSSVEEIYRQENIPSVNSTDYSVEEIATRIMAMTGLERRMK
ncbi:posphoenolpyruvate synthetase regulatory kinase/phosphorylase PpsR [Endozoicomonas euniceicola]|uniref:Putative phosphoenolpyruvate synthase regulatory protein n=1 Tax=Endozoicomonas euniceicola TaxID=1234143 RepID=A0ABY6GUL7_9GAMM|nr:pyruvate, water dikinase regulatory protein [Endozoicomonas euniceicola]UYM15776.1 kinase/pyrophosphorylase [Endozoicomonas euniceicola]